MRTYAFLRMLVRSAKLVPITIGDIMAIYHYHREIGKRHSGKNSVFAVAYIRGENRTCHKTQEIKDFTYKHDVIYAECLLPNDAPEWALKLRNSQVKGEDGDYVFDKTGVNFSDHAWNQIEFMEKRLDSQLYFHDDFAIPVELDKDSAVELVRDFVKGKLAVEGVFCDVAIHWDLINPHAHVVMPLRQLTEEGFSKKRRFGKGELSQLVTQIRSDWADYANLKMKELGIDARIDHRSYKDRGLALTPTIKVGKATYMHDTKLQEIRVAENQMIRAQNLEKIKAAPDVLTAKISQECAFPNQDTLVEEVKKYVVGAQVLSQVEAQEDASKERLVNEVIDTLRQEKTVFSERELKSMIMEKSESLDEVNRLVARIGESAELFNLGLGDDGRIHYVTRQAFQLETDLSQTTERLSNKNNFLVSDEDVRRVSKEFGLNEGQRIALKHLTQSGNLALVVGVAGSGKTYMLKAAKAVWEASGYRVRGVAFSGRAAAGLENDAGICSQTIAGFMKSMRQGYTQFGPSDILVMDEMGMTSLDDMQQVVKVVAAAGGKFAGVGDTEQTQPVGRGAPMRAMIEQAGCVVMDTVIRQKLDWQAGATLMMEKQQTAEGLDVYHSHGRVHMGATACDAKALVVEHWYSEVKRQAPEAIGEHILIAFKNETVAELNRLARAKLVNAGRIEQGSLIDTRDGALELAVGDRVQFGRNDYRLHVKNGDFGTVTHIDDQPISVRLDNEREVTFDSMQYRDFKYGYAATVHKLQGVTTDHAFQYIDSRAYDRHLFLVGSSRHRQNLTIIADNELFKDYDDLKQVVSRHGLKDHIFDYPASFAIRRGFEADGIAKRAVNFVRHKMDKVHDGWLWLTNYQSYIEKQAQGTVDLDATLKQQRRDAVIVADFCDKRFEILYQVEAIKALPGYDMTLVPDVIPEDAAIQPKVVTLYQADGTLMFAARDEQGLLVRRDIDTQGMDESLLASIHEKLSATSSGARLDEKETEAIFNVLSKDGYQPVDFREKIALMREIYKQQLDNSELAREIAQDFEQFKLAMDRNRISQAAVEKSVAFGERFEEIKSIADSYRLQQFYNPIKSDEIITNMPDYYGHIVSAFGETQEKNQFIAGIRHQMHQHRYDTAFENFSVQYRAEIKAVKHYLDLDYEVGSLLSQKSEGAIKIEEKLKLISNKRNEIAHQIIEQFSTFEPIVSHFDVAKKRLLNHQAYHLARGRVKCFSELPDSTRYSDNLVKQALAHRIKALPKYHGIYVNDYLKEGWKTINLENWRFEQKQKIAKMSPAFKASYRLVRRYFDAAFIARDAWQAAIKRRDAGSPHAKNHIKRAESLSVQRDKLASLLINDMEKHSGAIGFEKVDLAKLSSRARHYDYFARYLNESNRIRQLHMAHYMSENLKSFGHLVNSAGRYQEIKEKARHYHYLQLVDQAPTQSVRDIIRIAERYHQKRIEAGRAWGSAKGSERLGKACSRLVLAAKHLSQQRNRLAYAFIQATAEQGIVDSQIKGINLDYERLNRDAKQHIAYQNVQSYLNANRHDKGYWANELLKDRASYHFIFDKSIKFKTLKLEANAFINQQTMMDKKSEVFVSQRWDFELISQTLMENPMDTYTALFGEPKKRSTKEWRYEGGLIVSLKGKDAGKWYSFTENKGGGPIKAIQESMGLSFKDSLEYGAKLAGLSEAQAITSEILIQEKTKRSSSRKTDLDTQWRDNNIIAARSIWDGTKTLSGTLAERYFNEHRGINDLSGMEIRYWPANTQWMNIDESGKLIEKINKVPAAVIAVRDLSGELTGVQRIYLDQKTANKAAFMDNNPKLSKGVIQGSAGLIQKGRSGGCLYIAEGPETGASIALVDPDATVLVSMGVHNLPNLAPVISAYTPRELILAADNDGKQVKTREATELAFAQLQSTLNTTTLDCRLVYPSSIEGLEKVDWNDVLMHLGDDAVKTQLGLIDKSMSASDLYYDGAEAIAYTPAEHYLREVKGLMGVDLSDLRYHRQVPLSDGQSYQHALIVPAINQKGEQKAELIMLLSKDGKQVTQTMLRGDTENSVAVIQRGDDTSTVFITNNLVDAKSIAVGDPNATIFLSLHHYHDLNDIAWAIDTLPNKPGAIALVTDHFDQHTEKTLFELSQPLRDRKHHVVMVKGKLEGDYTHVSINEALSAQDKVRGTSYIQRRAIKPPPQEKQSLIEKLSRTIKGKKTAPVDVPAIKRPDVGQNQPYYITFTKSERQALNAYFESNEKLLTYDSYQNAIQVANAANSVYDTLKEKVRDINFHPQHVNRIQSDSDFNVIKDRILHRQPIGLLDASFLLKDVATIKLDTQSREELSLLANHVSKQDLSQSFEAKAAEFIRNKSTLIKAWQKNELMPGSGHSFTARDATKLVSNKINRDVFLGMTKVLSGTVRDKNKSLSRSQGKKQEDDRSRGGRSR